MTDILLGLIAIVVGLIFCFGGVWLMRLVIPIWGAFAGFSFGAGLVAGFTGDGFLATTLGWVVGLVFALIFGVFAYLYYAVAVVLAMGAVGFALGSGLMVALGFSWNWLIVLVAIAAGLVFGLLAVLADMPMILLVVVAAVGGAAVAVSGLMLVFGSIDSSTFTDGGFVGLVRDDWWWYVVYLVLAILGVLAQSRSIATLKVSLRQQWAGSEI